jgi:hypothetical protein
MVRRILEKSRAILGTSLVGGGLGALLGAIVPGLVALIAPNLASLGTVALGTAAMGLFGAFAAGGFATLLALGPEGRALSELSIPKSAALGLLAGAVFPTLAALATGGWVFPLALVEHDSEPALPNPSADLRLEGPEAE